MTANYNTKQGLNHKKTVLAELYTVQCPSLINMLTNVQILKFPLKICIHKQGIRLFT